ncbi:MAG: hypothetical protein QXY18_07320 [Nitrososphaerota archaeon]
MVDKEKLQEAIYKYEYLIKDENTVYDGTFAQYVFKDALGIEEDEVNEIKQNYCKKDSEKFDLVLQKSQLTKKYLYILQILPFQAKIHYYKYDLEGIINDIKSKKEILPNNHQEYRFDTGINKETYKYTNYHYNKFLLEYLDDLYYNNPTYEEIPYKKIEDIQKDLLRKENPNFEDLSHNAPGEDIKINNIEIELKSTKSLKKMFYTDFCLRFDHTESKLADYFILSYIFEDNQNMINIIMKNYNYGVEEIAIYVPKSFVDIINDDTLSDTEKIEKIKDIPISYKGIPLKFYTTKEVFEFFNSL